MLPNLQSAQILNNIVSDIERHYEFFKEQGIDYTRGYLSSVGWLRRIVIFFTLENNKYAGAIKFVTEKGVEERGIDYALGYYQSFGRFRRFMMRMNSWPGSSVFNHTEAFLKEGGKIN